MSGSFLLRFVLSAVICVNAVSSFVQHTTPFATRKPGCAQFEPSSTQIWERRDDDDVQVNLIPDVDSVTLTAIGFAAIAFNFFVLANAGDGGIAGVLATIINTLNQ